MLNHDSLVHVHPRQDNAKSYRPQLHALLAHVRSSLGRSKDEPVHLAGASWGGAVVADYAATYPSQVAGVAMLVPVSGPLGTAFDKLKILYRLYDFLLSLLAPLILLRLTARAKLLDATAADMLREQWSVIGTQKALFEMILKNPLIMGTKRLAFLKPGEPAPHWVLWRKIGKNGHPTVVMYAREDQNCPAISAEAAIQQLRNARCEATGDADKNVWVRCVSGSHFGLFDEGSAIWSEMLNLLKNMCNAER